MNINWRSCRTVSALCLFFIDTGISSGEIKWIISYKASFIRNSRFLSIQNLFAIKLLYVDCRYSPNNRIHQFVYPYDFLRLGFPSPPTFRLHTFSLSRHASTGTFNSDPIPEVSSSFHDTRVQPGLQRLCLFGATSSCTNIITKKKKSSNVY